MNLKTYFLNSVLNSSKTCSSKRLGNFLSCVKIKFKNFAARLQSWLLLLQQLQKLLKISCTAFVIILSLKVAYAEDIKLVFVKDGELQKKLFESFPKQPANSGYQETREVFFAKYDLNDDGKSEYIIKAKFKKPCSRSLRPTCIEIVVFDNDFKMISQDYAGFNEMVKILEVKHGGYNDILLSFFYKKKIHTRTLKFNTTYQKYDIFE